MAQTVTKITVPFDHYVLDNLQDGLLKGYKEVVSTRYAAMELPTLEPYMLSVQPDQLSDDWKPYDNQVERKKLRNDLPNWPYPLQRLFLDLMSPLGVERLQEATLGCWQKIPGLVADKTLHGAGIHVSGPGDFLGTHLDYSLHPKLSPPMERRLNLVLFLVPEWKEEWGGALQFWNDDATEVVSEVYPKFGRAVVWEPSDIGYHSTSRISDDCPVWRTSAAVYYVAPARPTTTRKRALFVPHRGMQ